MRVYVPLLLRELIDVDATLPRRWAFGVTSALQAAEPDSGEEDLEFEAMCAALDAARELGTGRRVVAAADSPAAGRLAGGGDGRLHEEMAVQVTDVVSFHVEEGEGPAGAGYDDLLWYDVTELAHLTG